MTLHDLVLLNFNIDASCSAAPYPRFNAGNSPKNALELDLYGPEYGLEDIRLFVGPESRLRPLASEDPWHAQDDSNGNLLDNYLAAPIYSSIPDVLALPQRSIDQEACAASTISSSLASDDITPQAFLTQAELMLYTHRLQSSSIPLGGPRGALGVQPAIQQAGGQDVAELCIPPALLHAPSIAGTFAEAYPVDMHTTVPKGPGCRSPQKGLVSGFASSRTLRSKPYVLSPRLPSPSSLSISTSSSAPTSDTQSHLPTHAPDVIVGVRRNVAVPTGESNGEPASPPTDPWQCPYCPYVQVSHRKADLKRHISTHTNPRGAENAHWVCCGVPLCDVLAGKYGTQAMENAMRESPFHFHGYTMVGGCRRAFSRDDALRRHLRNRKGQRCLGDERADWQMGNRLTPTQE